MIKCFEMTDAKRKELNKSRIYGCDHLAYTLLPEYVDKAMTNGWLIHTEIQEDYYEWINEFCAIRLSDRAAVWGDFEDKVFASSQAAFDEFMQLFPPEVWDYWDI